MIIRRNGGTGDRGKVYFRCCCFWGGVVGILRWRGEWDGGRMREDVHGVSMNTNIDKKLHLDR